jgi:ABC-type tungstate transport system permease subunit
MRGFVAAVLAMAAGCAPPAAAIRLATTTSVENSGLLTAVLPLGSGRALHALVVAAHRPLAFERVAVRQVPLP